MSIRDLCRLIFNHSMQSTEAVLPYWYKSVGKNTNLLRFYDQTHRVRVRIKQIKKKLLPTVKTNGFINSYTQIKTGLAFLLSFLLSFRNLFFKGAGYKTSDMYTNVTIRLCTLVQKVTILLRCVHNHQQQIKRQTIIKVQQYVTINPVQY